MWSPGAWCARVWPTAVRRPTPHAAQSGREGVEQEWEKSDEFHEKWKMKARELLANMEWRKRKVVKRVGAARNLGRVRGRHVRARPGSAAWPFPPPGCVLSARTAPAAARRGRVWVRVGPLYEETPAAGQREGRAAGL